MNSNLPRLVTRVPDNTHKKFVKLSKLENRSISNMLAYIVRSYIAEYEERKGTIEIDK